MRDTTIRVSDEELEALKAIKPLLWDEMLADEISHGATVKRLCEEYSGD